MLRRGRWVVVIETSCVRREEFADFGRYEELSMVCEEKGIELRI